MPQVQVLQPSKALNVSPTAYFLPFRSHILEESVVGVANGRGIKVGVGDKNRLPRLRLFNLEVV